MLSIYTPHWEDLLDAAKRIAAGTGISLDAAKIALCQAISDQEIKIRAQILGRVLPARLNVEIPTRLRPSDIDWEQSRPFKPWRSPRLSYDNPTFLDIELVEVLRDDVSNVFCNAEEDNEKAPPTDLPRAARRRRSKSKPGLERARRAILAIYSNEVPSQVDEPNAYLVRRVGEWLKQNRLREVSDDTILRAAGRRK